MNRIEREEQLVADLFWGERGGWTFAAVAATRRRQGWPRGPLTPPKMHWKVRYIQTSRSHCGSEGESQCRCMYMLVLGGIEQERLTKCEVSISLSGFEARGLATVASSQLTPLPCPCRQPKIHGTMLGWLSGMGVSDRARSN
jgi:hypothetical protein